MARQPAKTAAPAPAPTTPAQPGLMPINSIERGNTGLKVWNGYVAEDFLPELVGMRGIETYKEMSSNDPTVGGVLSAIGLILRACEWNVEPAKGASEEEAQAEADFVKSCLNDCSHTFEDFLAEALTMLTFGWSYHEIVYKRRLGPTQKDPSKRSQFEDGRIGWRKFAPRSQDSLNRWDMQDDGGINGMIQNPPQGGPEIFLPIERSLLFRPTSRKNSPESVSILRTAYRPWWYLKRIQESEAIGIERELTGLPIVRIPSYILSSTDAERIAERNMYAKIARDLRFNQQGGVVIPSDTWKGKDDSVSNVPIVSVELVTSGGNRTIETTKVKVDYQRDIARCVLADFIMLGTDKGAFNLAESKTSLFMKACESFNNQIASVLNRHALPRLWAVNGLDFALMPRAVPGRLAPADIAGISDFIEKLSRSGATFFPDDELENALRRDADLPEKSQEVMDMHNEAREEEEARAAETAAATVDATYATAEAKRQQARQKPPKVKAKK